MYNSSFSCLISSDDGLLCHEDYELNTINLSSVLILFLFVNWFTFITLLKHNNTSIFINVSFQIILSKLYRYSSYCMSYLCIFLLFFFFFYFLRNPSYRCILIILVPNILLMYSICSCCNLERQIWYFNVQIDIKRDEYLTLTLNWS